MIAGFEIIKNMLDFAIGVDKETNAVNAVVGFAHKGLFTPDAKLLANLVIFIGQQREVQQLFFGKTGKFFRFVSADTQHFNAHFLQIIHVIAQAACLDGTAWRHRFRVEIHQNTLSLEVGQIYLFSVLIRQAKFRCDITGFQWIHYLTPSCSSCCE